VETKPSVEAVNQQLLIVEFRDRTVGISDLATISSMVTDISFISCHSKEWREVGKRLATLSQLKTLSVEHCNSKDSLCVSICDSKTLASVRMGELCVTQKTAVSPTKESENYLE
jgi:hypothetical protein